MEEQQTEDRFLTFGLSGLLPDGAKIRLDSITRIVTRIEADGSFSEQVTFPPGEYDVFVALLSAHPYYSSREALLSAYSRRSLADCIKRINDAQDANDVDLAIKQVRGVLHRARAKMHCLGLEAQAIVDTGYMLMVYTYPERKRRH